MKKEKNAVGLSFLLIIFMSIPDQTSIGEYQKISKAPVFLLFLVWLSTEFFWFFLLFLVLDAFCGTYVAF